MAAGGGAWKVAYADFVTAMMAFFLVMWLTSQKPEVKQAVAGYFSDPWGTSAESSSQSLEVKADVAADNPGAKQPGRLRDDALRKTPPKDRGATGSKSSSHWVRGYRLHVLQEGDRLPPAVTLMFEESSAQLSDDALRVLKEAVPPMVGKSNRMEVRAHSSRRPLPPDSPFQDHWQLGFARAQEVMRYLTENGIEPERVRLSQSASHEPLVDNLDPAWQRENSRVEIYLLKEYVKLSPGGSPVSDFTSVGELPASENGLIHTTPSEVTAPADLH